MPKLTAAHLLVALGLGLPQVAGAAEVSVQGFVNIYPFGGLPTHAKANQANLSFEYDEDKVTADGQSVGTGANGRFVWKASPVQPAEVTLDATLADQPGQYRLKKPRPFTLGGAAVDLKEVRLFDVRRAAQDDYATAQKKINALRAGQSCLKQPQTVAAIWACWSSATPEQVAVRSEVKAALSDLSAISNHPAPRAIVREKLGLMTSAAMFCAEKNMDADQYWIDQADDTVEEQAQALMYCAQGQGFETEPYAYAELRSFLKDRLTRDSRTSRRRLLALWLDSYFREGGTNELPKLAPRMNAAGYFSEWRYFLDAVSDTTDTFPSFFENEVTADQIEAARNALR